VALTGYEQAQVPSIGGFATYSNSHLIYRLIPPSSSFDILGAYALENLLILHDFT
jgi:hypothetical protein